MGEYVWRLQEQSDGQGNDTAAYMPLREAEVTASLFRVGSHLDFTAIVASRGRAHDGELVCFANDADWLYWNNEGQLRVDVTRTSWPPVAASDLHAAVLYRGGVWEEGASPPTQEPTTAAPSTASPAPNSIRAVIFCESYFKAPSARQTRGAALHREAALTGVRRRGEEDDVAVGEIAAAGERLDDAALSGKRRVRGRVREGEGDGVADFEGDGSFRARGCGIVGRGGGRRLAISRCRHDAGDPAIVHKAVSYGRRLHRRDERP